MEEKQYLEELKSSLLEDVDDVDVVEVANRIVDAGIDINRAIDVAADTIRNIGDRFETGEIFLPDLMVAGKKMELIMNTFKPHIKGIEKRQIRASVILGTVKGDIHDIGKNLVATQLAVGGLDVIDLGVDVDPMTFIDEAKKQNAKIISLSALMTNSIPYQRDVINILKAKQIRDHYFVIVGGGPVSLATATEMGADGWAKTAVGARKICEKILGSNQKPPFTKPLTP